MIRPFLLAFAPSANILSHGGIIFSRVKRMATSLSCSSGDWSPGSDLLRLDPSTLSKEGPSQPQLAKDEDYASAILKSWGEEFTKRTAGSDGGGSISSPFTYNASDGTPLYGHVYRPSPPPPSDDSSSAENSLPGIILFHTGAGPQDIFLRWKADSLVNDRDTFGEGGCVVLIADILGDESGWAWHDRERYDLVRKSVLLPDENGQRNKLADRVQAAIDALAAQPGVDAEKIGAMGFCLGGHPILEMAKMKNPSIRVVVTFHGVFDGVRKLSSVESCIDEGTDMPPAVNVLACTGADDPFISEEDLDAAIKMFGDLGCQSKVMKFENTRHGFTNPAQDYNPNKDAFAYNEESYDKAWSAALSLLKDMAC